RSFAHGIRNPTRLDYHFHPQFVRSRPNESARAVATALCAVGMCEEHQTPPQGGGYKMTSNVDRLFSDAQKLRRNRDGATLAPIEIPPLCHPHRAHDRARAV